MAKLLYQAWAYVNLNGTVAASAEDWNPNDDPALALKVTKQDAGIYDVEAPAELGLTILCGMVTAQYTPAVSGVVESVTDDRIARVHLTDAAGLDIDCAFVVQLY